VLHPAAGRLSRAVNLRRVPPASCAFDMNLETPIRGTRSRSLAITLDPPPGIQLFHVPDSVEAHVSSHFALLSLTSIAVKRGHPISAANRVVPSDRAEP